MATPDPIPTHQGSLMNTKMLLSTALAGVLWMSFAPSAGATDIKAHHGSECKVYGTTSWADLGFGWQGIYNTTETPKVIVCPLVKDSESNWDGDALTPTNAAYVDVHYKATTKAGSITCTAYVSRQSGLTSAKTFTDNIPKQSESFTNIDALVSNGSPNDAGSIMICNLGGKAVLQHYRLVEPAATDS